MSSPSPHHAPAAAAHAPAAAASTPSLLQKYKWKIMAVVVGAIALFGGSGGYMLKKNIDAAEANEFRDNARTALTHVEELKQLWVPAWDHRIRNTEQALRIFINMGDDAVDNIWDMSPLIITLNTHLENTISTIQNWGTSVTFSSLLDSAEKDAKTIESASLESIQKELSESIKSLKEDIKTQPKKYSWLKGNYFSDSWGENVSDAFGIDWDTFDATHLTQALDALEKNPELFSQALDDPMFWNLFLDALKVENGYSQLLKIKIENKAGLMKALIGLLKESQASNVLAGAEKIPGGIVNILWLLYILWVLFGGGTRYFQTYKENKNPTPPDPLAPAWTPTRAETLKKKWDDWMKYWILTKYVGKFSKDYIWKPVWWGVKKIAWWSFRLIKDTIHDKKHQKKLDAISAEKRPIEENGRDLMEAIQIEATRICDWVSRLEGFKTTHIPTKIAPINAEIATKNAEITDIGNRIRAQMLEKTRLEWEIQNNEAEIKDYKAKIKGSATGLDIVLQLEITERDDNKQKLSLVAQNIAALEAEKTKKESEKKTLEKAKNALDADTIIADLKWLDQELEAIFRKLDDLKVAAITDPAALQAAWEEIKKLAAEHEPVFTSLASVIEKCQKIQQLIV